MAFTLKEELDTLIRVTEKAIKDCNEESSKYSDIACKERMNVNIFGKPKNPDKIELALARSNFEAGVACGYTIVLSDLKRMGITYENEFSSGS